MSPTEALHVHAITWSCNNELPLNKTFNNKISDALQPLKELLNPPGNFGSVRLGNPDLDISQSNAKSENRFHLREIRPQGGFQLRNPNPDFMDFLFTVRLGNPKKDLQNYSREQWSFFCEVCVCVQDRCS